MSRFDKWAFGPAFANGKLNRFEIGFVALCAVFDMTNGGQIAVPSLWLIVAIILTSAALKIIIGAAQ